MGTGWDLGNWGWLWYDRLGDGIQPLTNDGVVNINPQNFTLAQLYENINSDNDDGRIVLAETTHDDETIEFLDWLYGVNYSWLQAKHAYTVGRCFTGDDDVMNIVLRNPWGETIPEENVQNGEFYIRLDYFRDLFNWVAI